jgi:bis(5'-nucleosyl)-tetraphosphatase (symmetrical)
MATYLIGDVQGCFKELQQLLRLVDFNPQQDRLGFVGDLVNRGPQSLEVLRFVKSLNAPMVVLGNHDLYLLILGYGLMPADAYQHTLYPILEAPDRLILLDLLRQQSLVYHDATSSILLVHAGIPPQWTITQSIQYAAEAEKVLRSSDYANFLKNLFGNDPGAWHDDLRGQDRLRYIVNAFTRMRFCDKQGHLDLIAHGNISSDVTRFQPWFNFRDPQQDQIDIFFGHWASLNGQCPQPHCYALDTGCVWGHALTAIRLEDKKQFSLSCPAP